MQWCRGRISRLSISPHCSKPRKGRPQMPLATTRQGISAGNVAKRVMLRIYFLQQWYGLPDSGITYRIFRTFAFDDGFFQTF